MITSPTTIQLLNQLFEKGQALKSGESLLIPNLTINLASTTSDRKVNTK